MNGPIGAPLRRAPFAAHVAVNTGIYLGIILFGLKSGDALFHAPGEGGIESGDVLFSLAAAFVFVFILDVNSLLGQNVLLNFITGQYYRPRVEPRVFLFLDMEGSTGWAERLGPLDFHRLLNRFVPDVTEPMVAARGEIHRYIGDELIATWKVEGGIQSARCIVVWFDAMDRLADQAPEYVREFGAAVAAPAGLDCGPVVTGEMGSVRREIVFLGDTVNTTARIQDLCRQTGDRVLASADLIDRLELPAETAKRSLGDLRLRGKGADLALYALTKGADTRRPPPRRPRGRAAGDPRRPVVTGIMGRSERQQMTALRQRFVAMIAQRYKSGARVSKHAVADYAGLGRGGRFRGRGGRRGGRRRLDAPRTPGAASGRGAAGCGQRARRA
jgi:adenylate cyclase